MPLILVTLLVPYLSNFIICKSHFQINDILNHFIQTHYKRLEMRQSESENGESRVITWKKKWNEKRSGDVRQRQQSKKVKKRLRVKIRSQKVKREKVMGKRIMKRGRLTKKVKQKRIQQEIRERKYVKNEWRLRKLNKKTNS